MSILRGLGPYSVVGVEKKNITDPFCKRTPTKYRGAVSRDRVEGCAANSTQWSKSVG